MTIDMASEMPLVLVFQPMLLVICCSMRNIGHDMMTGHRLCSVLYVI